jgi:hypothetical protein
MKAQYDFSKAERGKFYRPNAVFHYPIYLEPDVEQAIREIADARNIDMQRLINEWLRANLKIVQSVPMSAEATPEAVQA